VESLSKTSFFGLFYWGRLGAKISTPPPIKRNFTEFVLFVNMTQNLPSLGNTRDFQYRLPHKDDNDDSIYTTNPEGDKILEDETKIEKELKHSESRKVKNNF